MGQLVTSISEFLDLTPRVNNKDHAVTKQSAGIKFSGPSWSSASMKCVAGAWNPDDTINGFPRTTNVCLSSAQNWMSILDQTITAFGEDSISGLLSEVDAMESPRKPLPWSTSVMKFGRELIEDGKDDCFSSMEEFSSVLSLSLSPIKLMP